jgi:chemotaxis signal transduction protein
VSAVHLRLCVGGETYALPVEHVREVTELGDVSPLPGSTDAILGVRNLRGQVVPVFDLASVLGIASDGAAPRLVIAEAEGRLAALAVDEVTNVSELPEQTGESDMELLSGTALYEGELVGVIDVAATFRALERQASV